MVIPTGGSIKKSSFDDVFLKIIKWWSVGDSNSWPIDCEPIALPTELTPQMDASIIALLG